MFTLTAPVIEHELAWHRHQIARRAGEAAKIRAAEEAAAQLAQQETGRQPARRQHWWRHAFTH